MRVVRQSVLQSSSVFERVQRYNPVVVYGTKVSGLVVTLNRERRH